MVFLTAFGMLLGSMGFLLSLYEGTREPWTSQGILYLFPMVMFAVGMLADIYYFIIGKKPKTRYGKRLSPDRNFVLSSLAVYGICLVWSFYMVQ